MVIKILPSLTKNEGIKIPIGYHEMSRSIGFIHFRILTYGAKKKNIDKAKNARVQKKKKKKNLRRAKNLTTWMYRSLFIFSSWTDVLYRSVYKVHWYIAYNRYGQ